MNPAGERSQREGLGQHAHARVRMTIAGHRAFGIAGHEQDLAFLACVACHVGHLSVVHGAEQADVGHQRADDDAGVQPFGLGVGVKESAVDALGRCPQYPMESGGVGPAVSR